MTSSDYDTRSSELLAEAEAIQRAKRPGYTVCSPDVLANFKTVGERAGISASQAWAVYFLKHVDAILTVMTRPGAPVAEPPVGRFADAINYLLLGWALLQERENPE